MAVASLDQFQAQIQITDSPVGYTPPVGNDMRFFLQYQQREALPLVAPNWSNLGPKWECNWISYLVGGPTNDSADATLYAPGGAEYNYTDYQPEALQGEGVITVNEGDFQGKEAWTNGTLHYRQGPERYERWLPDGSIETFAQSIGANPNRQFFLTSIKDPHGNITKLTYAPAAAAQGQAILTSVTDPVGGQLVFGYNESDPLKISTITRSSDHLFSRLGYTNGVVTSIKDTIGIVSSFHYTSGTDFIDTMTTPYGATTFGSTDGPTSLEADMTNPLGQSQRVEYQASLSTSIVPASEAQAPSATGLSIDNSGLNTQNSFYWNRRAMSEAAGTGAAPGTAAFYALAQVTHWATTPQGSILPLALSIKQALQSRVWYNYPVQPDPDHVDLSASGSCCYPSMVARLVESSTSETSYVTQTMSYTYNTLGLVTQRTDPRGRITYYDYDSTNHEDLLKTRQQNGSGTDTIASLTYDTQHDPLTVTDASGRTTTLTYNAQGQPLTSTNAKSEETTYAYYGNGYLHTVTGPVAGATTTFTYDSSNRPQTVTGSDGYAQSFAYDDLDRPTSVTYPDGTTDQTFYDKLDAVKTVDRAGRATTMQYDAIRELVLQTDPLGRTTQYGWCTCGGLSMLTDPNGNVTQWQRDVRGRVTAKVYPDSTATHYAYETDSGNVYTVTDALGNVTTNSYNVDGTLNATAYSPASGVAATVNVSFAYDTVYNRTTSMTDGTGTTSYSYNPITGSVTTGAGQLASVTSPIAGSTATVTYSYDELGRATGRGVDAATTNANNISTTFDTLGRVTGITNPLGAFTYGYVDQTSRLSSMTYPSGTGLSTSYAYFDNVSDERLQEIKNLNGTSVVSKFDYTYNAVGTIATWKQQADSSTPNQYGLTYDGANQLTDAELVNTGTSSTIASNKYNYDPSGNRLAETTLTGTAAGQFNNLNQLTAYSGSAGSQTVAGNTSAATSSLTVNAVPATISGGTNFSASVPLPTGTNTVSVVAQPASGTVTTKRFQLVITGTAAPHLTYDANGNTLTDENGNTYQWDALNRLTAIYYPSGAESDFAYDGMSRRISIIEKDATHTVTSTKNFLWIGTEIAEERDSSNTVTKRFFAQGEQQSGTNYYYFRDHLGSVRELVDGSGDIEARYSYDPYGRTTKVSGSLDATFQYAGYYAHAASGLRLTLFRAFDLQTGRWLSRDPSEETGGVNLYSFVSENPDGLTDSLGLCPGDRPKCMHQYLLDNYGDFVANTLVPDFALGSIASNLSDYAKTTVESIAVKGSVIAVAGATASYFQSLATNIMSQSTSDFGEYFGLYARADAAEAAVGGSEAAAAFGAVFGDAVAALGTAAFSFASGAQLMAYINCAGEDP